jgi:hypothetical protein
MASPMSPPLPILLEYWLPALSARSLPRTQGWNHEVPDLTRKARLLTAVSLGLPLVWVVYGWLLARRGWVVGAIGGGLTALSPSILAAASIATTDACFTLFGLVALAAMRPYQSAPSNKALGLAGLGLGLALASKQTAVVLTPVLLLELFLGRPDRTPGATRVDHWLRAAAVISLRFAAALAIAFMVDWGFYAFHFAPPYGLAGTHTRIPIVIPMVTQFLPNGDAILEAVRRTGPPLALDTFLGMLDRANFGHDAFLMGMHSFCGWWYFFPVAIALKSTPAELVLFVVAATLAVRPATWRDPTRRLWMAATISLLGLAMCSSLNIGHRYILLAYPLVILLASDAIGERTAGRPRARAIMGVALISWQVLSNSAVAPHYLCYFNSFCGGPTQGYRYLVDSSLDWGQGLPALRKELEARGYHKVALMYFGTALPEAYGLKAIHSSGPGDPVAKECDYMAISATYMTEVYVDASPIQRLDALPKHLAGYSIFFWDLKDPRVRAIVDESRVPTDALQPPPSPRN